MLRQMVLHKKWQTHVKSMRNAILAVTGVRAKN